MRIGPFIHLISTTYGLPESSVAFVARVMREAGWLTTGARGVNAPEMTATDAARLTLALLSGQPPGTAVSEFEFLRTLEATDPYPEHTFTANTSLATNHSFEDALVWLFSLSSASHRVREHGQTILGDFYWPYISVSVDGSARAAQFSLPGHTTAYEDVAGERELEALGSLPYSFEKHLRLNELWNRSESWDTGVVYGRGMRAIRKITEKEIQKIADAMAVAD